LVVENSGPGMTKADFASAFYRQGVEAMELQQWDLALERFRQCVRLFPDNAMYRQLAEKCSDKQSR
jgi:predicted Zn-dependent protease